MSRDVRWGGVRRKKFEHTGSSLYRAICLSCSSEVMSHWRTSPGSTKRVCVITQPVSLSRVAHSNHWFGSRNRTSVSKSMQRSPSNMLSSVVSNEALSSPAASHAARRYHEK